MNSKVKDITLMIDTADNKKSMVKLVIAGDIAFTKTLFNSKSEKVLEMINRLLTDNKISFSDIDRICVNTGPGSYTGIRVGLAISCAISLLLDIPVKNQFDTDDLDPIYAGDKYAG